MRNYALKNIPGDLYDMATSSAKANCRSLNQEIIFRLRNSFELDGEALRSLHQAWIDEALASGKPKPLTKSRLQAALKSGLERAKGKKA